MPLTLFTRRPAPIVVVSGLPRSGTSMMMRMLEAGGLEPITDAIRQADVDNPGGYYELEDVKALSRGEAGWLDGAGGKAVKVISALVEHLPPTHRYRLVFMHRHLDEVMRSQSKMLEHRDERDAELEQTELRAFYTRHLAELSAWLDARDHVETLHVNYGHLVSDPASHAGLLGGFLGRSFDARAAEAVIDPSLYRNRAAR